VSKHLRVLRKVGLVDVRDAGRQRVYRLNGYPLKLIHDWVKNYERSWSQRFDRLDAVLAELREEERIVSTEIFEGMPDAEALVTATFTEKDGRTTLVMLVQHATREQRDAHINSGMEGGMQEAMDHLEQVAISLR
jgi:uncharacterized protein YndB with AHSA1/START domain